MSPQTQWNGGIKWKIWGSFCMFYLWWKKNTYCILFKIISFHFDLLYILYFQHLNQSPMSKAPWLLSTLRSWPLKCIKTSWKQDRIFNRCHRCFMESGHELSLSTRTTSSNILFVTLKVCFLNVSLLSVLSVLLSYEMCQDRTHLEPFSFQPFKWKGSPSTISCSVRTLREKGSLAPKMITLYHLIKY